jgi:tetratricopeptide (TPR) repeat protein
VFPGDVTWVADHARRAMSTFPVARGRYYGVDYGVRASEHADLRWYRDIPVPTSYMAMGSREDWFGGYDHAADAGFVHWADHAISPGKKLWTWGNHNFGHAWDRELSDDSAPYIELMAGVFTDNQPDFSYLAPGETRSFSQWWYPTQRIGPAHRATLDAAVHLSLGVASARVGVAVTRSWPAVRVRLTKGERLLLDHEAPAAPDAPIVLEAVPVPRGTRRSELLLRVTAGERPLVEHRPFEAGEGGPPDPAREPALPADVPDIETLVLIGRHLDQYRHATRRPEDYWREALRRSPDDSRANTEMGVWHLRRGDAGSAVEHLRRAVTTLTNLNDHPADGTALYALGLALREQDDLPGADEALASAAWLDAWHTPATIVRAELASVTGRLDRALELLDGVLRHDPWHAGARTLRAALARRAGRLAEAIRLVADALADDPLDARALVERDRLIERGVDASRSPMPAVMHRPDDAQIALDVAHDDARAGLEDDAIRLLETALPGAAPETAPLVAYTLAWLAERAGDRSAAASWRARARELPIERCFPGRPEEIAVLGSAVAADPTDPRAPYLLGLLLYDRRRYREAIALWRTSARLDGGFPTVHRDLGLAAYNVEHRPARALTAYRRAFRLDASDARVLYELDQLRKRLGHAPAARLAAIRRHRAIVLTRDDLTVELITLLNETGRHEEARTILAGRRFHPWEGGEGLVSTQWVVANRELARAALVAGDATRAIAFLTDARDRPPNLGEARHLLTPENELHWLLARAHEAAGRAADARSSLRDAAASVTDPAAGTVPADLWRALALRESGDMAAADALLRTMLHESRERRTRPARVDYFATSLPSFLLFTDDLALRQRIDSRYLEGLALLGLGRARAARVAFRDVARLDVDHLEARLRLQEATGSHREVPSRGA